MSLYARLLGEDHLQETGGGIGGRTAGAFHPFRVPLANAGANRVRTPDQIKKAQRRAENRAKTRDYLRQVALGEARRRLQSL